MLSLSDQCRVLLYLVLQSWLMPNKLILCNHRLSQAKAGGSEMGRTFSGAAANSFRGDTGDTEDAGNLVQCQVPGLCFLFDRIPSFQ